MSNNEKKPNALTDRKLMLVAPARDDAEIKYDKPLQPTLIPKIVDNQPHLEVRTGVVNDKNYGKIEAAMDAHTFWSLLAGMRRVIDNSMDQFTIECKGHPWTGQGRSKEPMVMTRVTCGRDADGWVWIMVTDYDKARPRIKFKFEPVIYHPWLNKEGQPMPSNTISDLYATAWINLMSSIMPTIIIDEFVTWQELKERREAKRNGNGNNNNRGNGNGNGNGYNKPAAKEPTIDLDDDIPF